MKQKYTFDMDIAFKNKSIRRLNELIDIIKLSDCREMLSKAAYILSDISSFNTLVSKLIYEEIAAELDKLARFATGVVDYDIRQSANKILSLVIRRGQLT